MTFKEKFRLFLQEYLNASANNQIKHPVLFAFFNTKERAREDLVPNWKKVEEKLLKAEKRGWLSGLDFSLLMQDLLISEDGYIIDTGNYENVNAALVISLINKIKKHPVIWSLFFKVI